MVQPVLQLQHEVISDCRKSLREGDSKREALDGQPEVEEWRCSIRDAVADWLDESTFDRPAVDSECISQHELEGYRIDNVRFESYPGWDVNASVYYPPEPGTYPGIVCPSGHSAKTGDAYQQPPQVFAKNGFVAVAFDAPGRGEKTDPENDHFRAGVLGYLSGVWSMSHFVRDALQCIDYLETREDTDIESGLGVTGVSGGGKTTIHTGLVDDRVSAIAPVCFGAEWEATPLSNLYTLCPEVFAPGTVSSGVGQTDLLGALVPIPCLTIAGAGDALNPIESVKRMHEGAARVYESFGAPNRFKSFVSDSDHTYNVTMANEVAAWFYRHFETSHSQPKALSPDSVQTVEDDRLSCNPSNEATMVSISRDRSAARQSERGSQPPDIDTIRKAATTVFGVDCPGQPVQINQSSAVNTGHAEVRELDISPTEHVSLPSVMISHEASDDTSPGLLWIDEDDRWNPIQTGMFNEVIRSFEERSSGTPRILSLNVSGLGKLSPDPAPYDFVEYCGIDRILTYLGVSLEVPVIGHQIRDALCGLEYLSDRSDVDTTRLLIGGRGIGAVVAVHAAVLAPSVTGLLALEPLAMYADLLEQYPYEWPQSIIAPGLLEHYDHPEAVAALCNTGVEASLINPLDAQRNVLSENAVSNRFDTALTAGATVRTSDDERNAVVDAIQSLY